MTFVKTDQLGFLVHNVGSLLRRRFEKRGAAFGLSAAQFRALARISKEEGISQAKLAELLEIEPISVSRLLDRMEEGGWIERRFDPGDRRVRTIWPTARSRAAYGEIKAVAGEVYEEALRGLSPTERTGLIHALQLMAANLAEDETGTAAGGPDLAELEKATA
jgi:MarR family transcriptional regulator, transcriptional regulator for hemolysin